MGILEVRSLGTHLKGPFLKLYLRSKIGTGHSLLQPVKTMSAERTVSVKVWVQLLKSCQSQDPSSFYVFALHSQEYYFKFQNGTP